MADFEFLDGGGSSGGSKKKKLDTKKLFIILAGLAAVAGLFVLLKNRSGSDAAPVYYPYSTNESVGTADSGSFISYSDLDSMLSDIGAGFDDLYKYVDEATDRNYMDLSTQLEEHVKNADEQMAEMVETTEKLDYEQSQEIYYQSMLNRMISNNRDYDLANTTEKRENLSRENQIIGKELGLTFHEQSGTWWKVDNEAGTVTRAFYTAAEESGSREKISEYPGQILKVGTSSGGSGSVKK